MFPGSAKPYRHHFVLQNFMITETHRCGILQLFLVAVRTLILEKQFGFVHVCAAGLQRALFFECFCSELRIEHTISPTSYPP